MSFDGRSSFWVVNDLPRFESSLESGNVVEFAALMDEHFFGGPVLGLPAHEHFSHVDFLDHQRALVKIDTILTRFERMYKEGVWDCDEQRGPCKEAREAYRRFKMAREMHEDMSRQFYAWNAKWLTWTRAADDPDAYLQEALASGAVRVCRRSESKLAGSYECPRPGRTYDVNGWGMFVYLFSRAMSKFSEFMRLTDVHQEVADLLLAVETKNQDPNGTEWYYVQMEWVTNDLCMVAGTDVDVFRPKKRAKLVRKSREALQASYCYFYEDNY